MNKILKDNCTQEISNIPQNKQIHIYAGNEYAQKVLNPDSNNNEPPKSATIVDMCYFSATLPNKVNNEIIRRNYLEYCLDSLKDNNILCLSGEYGVGVTTLLTQFAKSNSKNCVSYFNNGLDRICLNPEVIERSIVEQLYWFVYGNDEDFDHYKSINTTISSLYTYVLIKIKQTASPLYFVFDGFDNIPTEILDGLKKIFSNILWNNARFIFSGKSENIMRLFPEKINIKISDHEIMRFGEADVKEYFQALVPNINEDDLKKLYSITKGNAHRMDIVRTNYINKNRLDELFKSDITGESDLYDEDFQDLFIDDNELSQLFFGLLAYTEFPLSISLISKILETEEENIIKLQKKYNEHIIINDEKILKIKSEGFHKYLRTKLTSIKQKVELYIINVIEREENTLAYCEYLPAIYRSANKIDKLIDYLNINNIQQILIGRKSQAALNEQCNFGFEACCNHLEKYLPNIFRFALNKSTSQEIEKNELWDNEIEALLSVNQFDQAIILAQNIYLKEERLKAFLLIAKKRSVLTTTDYGIIKDNIDQLVNNIDFENIPNKAIELAKLLMPIDYEAATDIIDRISKINKDISSIDRIYALLSFAYNKNNPENITNLDLVSSKIQDDNLRIITHTANNLFNNVDVDYLLMELSKLPRNSQKLYFLQYWLPDHEDIPEIGKAVLEAIKLIVADSDTEIPKAKILTKICRTMKKMSLDEMKKAMIFIDSMGSSIKYPTYDYVDAELTIIEAIKNYLPEKAKSHLEELYLYIDELEDASIRLTCLSKLLGKFELLGKKSEIEKDVCSTVELRKEISEGVAKLLNDTAYHIKVIEGPIEALVCKYPSIIDELIDKVNTTERKNRAYSYAAFQYLLQIEENEIDLTYFFRLLQKSSTKSEQLKPLLLLSEILIYSKNLQHEKLLPIIKSNFNYIEGIESSKNKCIICIRIYLWIKKNFPTDQFANQIKNILINSWEAIDVIWFKIEIGFFMAKHFAKISKEEACEIIAKCRDLKQHSFLASSSCVASYRESLDLYILSLSNLIKLGICDNKLLQQFDDDIYNILSKSELAEVWGNIATEYYLIENNSMFKLLTDKYLPADYTKFSLFNQKCIIYQTAPALFIRNQSNFFKLLDKYDNTFKNDCIMHVCNFIITKKTLQSSTELDRKAYELSYTDYTNLLVLLEQASNDEIFFNIIEIISKSLKASNIKKEVLSTEQKNAIIAEAEQIIENKLPSKDGIQHNGYKFACQAALNYVKNGFLSKDKDTWTSKIDTINNKADQAFLYFLIAPYFSKRKDQMDFFNKGIEISESIKATFDKVNRLDMSISECIDYNLGSLIPNVAKSAMKSLANNGSLEEHKRLIDMAYQYKPEFAEQLINTLDKDPARIRYKQKLQQHILSVKKIESARKNMDTIDNLSPTEKSDFFETQLKNLLNGKGQLQNIQDAFSLTINYIYQNNIVNSKPALLYLIETICRKHKQSMNQKDLLLSIHESIRHNLKLVLSLAAGTKERLDRIESMIYEFKPECDGVINIGEYNKAETFLLSWYNKINTNKLIIIDPYFNLSSLSLLKKLSDIVDIEKIIAQKKGGRRKGTGRKKLAGNSPSVTMRVPQYIRKDIQALIDMYAHWCASDEESVLVSKTSVEQRLKTIEFLNCLINNEKNKLKYS